ncbi:MAG: hypothetical protein KF799_08865 [Bdellovibrionales bacterium]|nr:hypothetical protein [Bdellovibrionales bacterium]
MKNWTKTLILISACAALPACSVGKAAHGVAQTSVDNLGCKVAHSEMWNSLSKITEDGDTYPSSTELRQALLDLGAVKGFAGPVYDRYVDAFVSNYELTIGGIQEKFAPSSQAAWQKALAEMEVGVKVTEVHAKLAEEIEASLQKLKMAEKDLAATCPKPEEPLSFVPTTPQPLPNSNPTAFATVWEQLKANEKPEVYGSRLVLATAYQSCGVLSLPPMNASTPSVEGISKDPKPNPQNGGILRHYASVAKINSTHFYIKNQTLPKSSCYEVRNTPPIYDYGGKPYASSSAPTVLNMFKNGGTGSEVMGIDCSGYVFSALASAGLRMITPDPSKPLKSTLVSGIPAAAFKEPSSNGLRCLEKIKPSKTRTVEPGDVVAIKGHIVMIDSVGADPFGLNKITSAAKCTDAYIVPDNFNFVIAQSSPSKGGTGINLYSAKDYSKYESSTYRNGFVRYAIAACRDKFGLSPNLSSPDLSIVAHKKTAECLSPALTLSKQECVDSCRPL